MARTYDRVWEQRQTHQPPKPVATYTLLGLIGAVYVLQQISLLVDGTGSLHQHVFVIANDWLVRPWSLVTSTLSHSPVGLWHILVNGLFLYFFGPSIEAIIGPRKFFLFFFLTGAVSGVVQVEVTALLYQDVRGALGASGALGGLLGIALLLMPKSTVFLFPIPIPIRLWVLGIGFVAYNVLLGLNPASHIGAFAHLAGLAVGLVYGWRVKEDLSRRGMRLTYG